MHVIFIPYGDRKYVEHLLRDIEAQKHKLILTKGKKKKYVWVGGQVRMLPFGVYECIFPKVDLDMILTTLSFGIDYKNRMKIVGGIIRKFLKCQKIPEFKTEKKFLWYRRHIAIVLIGVRDDEEHAEMEGEHKGWKHESL